MGWPGSPGFAASLGHYYFKIGQLKDAERWFIQAMQLAPDNAAIGSLYLDFQRRGLQKVGLFGTGQIAAYTFRPRPDLPKLVALIAFVVTIPLIVLGNVFIWLGTALDYVGMLPTPKYAALMQPLERQRSWALVGVWAVMILCTIITPITGNTLYFRVGMLLMMFQWHLIAWFEDTGLKFRLAIAVFMIVYWASVAWLWEAGISYQLLAGAVCTALVVGAFAYGLLPKCKRSYLVI